MKIQTRLKMLKADIRTARGDARFVETTACGLGRGHRRALPAETGRRQGWGLIPRSVHGDHIGRTAFEAVLAATGTPPSLFTDADGTAQRESVRRWHLNTVIAAGSDAGMGAELKNWKHPSNWNSTPTRKIRWVVRRRSKNW